MNSYREFAERLGFSALSLQDQINLTTVALMYALLGVVGSGFSVVVVVCCFYTLARFPWREGMATVPRPVLALSAVGLLYFLSGVLMFALNPNDAETYDVLLERLPFLFFLPIAMQLALTDRHLLQKFFEAGCTGAGFAIGFWVMWQLSQDDPRVFGGAGNPGPFATTCAFVSAVCFASAIDSSGKRQKLALAAGVLAIFGIAASGMRLFFPYFLALPIILAFVFRGQIRALLRPINKLWIVAALILFGLIVLEFMVPRLELLIHSLDRSAFNPNASSSLGARITLWICASRVLPEIWFLGAGPSGALDYMKTCSLDLVGFELPFTHFHNFVITALMQGGIAEAVAVLMLVVTPSALLLHSSFRTQLEPIERFVLAVTLLLAVAYLLQGSLNLMFGHDIHDLLFIHSMSLLITIFYYPESRQPVPS